MDKSGQNSQGGLSFGGKSQIIPFFTLQSTESLTTILEWVLSIGVHCQHLSWWTKLKAKNRLIELTENWVTGEEVCVNIWARRLARQLTVNSKENRRSLTVNLKVNRISEIKEELTQKWIKGELTVNSKVNRRSLTVNSKVNRVSKTKEKLTQKWTKGQLTVHSKVNRRSETQVETGRHPKLAFLTQSLTIFQFYKLPNLHDPWFKQLQIYTGCICTNHHPQIYTPQFDTKFTQPLIYAFFQSVFYKVFFVGGSGKQPKRRKGS